MINQFRDQQDSLLAMSAYSCLWKLCIVNKIMVFHQNLCLLSHFMSHGNPMLILILVLHLKNQIKSGNKFSDLQVVEPNNLVQIPFFYVVLNYTSSQFSFSIWIIPFWETNRHPSCLVSKSINCFVRVFNIKKRVKRFNRQEHPIALQLFGFRLNLILDLGFWRCCEDLGV